MSWLLLSGVVVFLTSGSWQGGSPAGEGFGSRTAKAGGFALQGSEPVSALVPSALVSGSGGRLLLGSGPVQTGEEPTCLCPFVDAEVGRAGDNIAAH
jgi:hypothetical protein